MNINENKTSANKISSTEYSQTCQQRLSKGKTEYGLYRQVVLSGGHFVLFNQ